jgi:uncharacterized protein
VSGGLRGHFVFTGGSLRKAGRTSVGLERRIPQDWPKNVRADVPLPVAEKKLQWIDGETARWDGYLEFQRRPQPMLDWFAQYMS